jgi:tetratricopeptide (TPR) repeat protein
MDLSMNPYEILEIAPGSSAEDIKAAYHRLAKRWHPDRFTGPEKEEAEKRFRQLAEAFNMLRDAGKRDESGRTATATTVPTSAPVTIQLQQEPVPQTVPLHERTASDWYEEAKKAFDAKEFEKALGLIHYCIRMDAEKAEHHVLLAKVLDIGNGDKKALVKALENAIRLNPKDVDSTIRLAEVFQTVGMYARATKLWETARYLAPNHKYFVNEQRKATAKAKAAEQIQGMGEQFAVLKEQGKALINRLLKRG